MHSTILELLRDLASVLARFGGRWYLFGAQAVLIWGRPRLTGDVDVTIFLDSDDPDRLVGAMRAVGFTPRVTDVRAFAARTRVLPFTHEPTGIGLDAILGGPGFEEEFLRTARNIDLGGIVVPVIAPEALIVTKILAGRPKDLEDVEGILRAQEGGCDLARAHELLGILEAALARADLRPQLDELTRKVRERP